uniref:Uncharacterized protein n=1 Tax=Hemiselmis andersenii TaxID=464988 RepID=A0A7S1DKE5_HEMAN|mmetsp:Transcript_18129/g.43592  ORF Transcript_18129/g.43592 Transcript_18129/m.43592 type:complete len:124 (+) Transcript_18129:104-475(+)
MEIRRAMQHVVEEEDVEDGGAMRHPHEDEEEDFPTLPTTLGGFQGWFLAFGHGMYDALLPGTSRAPDGRAVQLEDGEELDGELMSRKYARRRGGKAGFGLVLSEVGSPVDSALMCRKYARYLQ